MSDSLVERFALLLALIIPSVIYIPCRQLDIAPVLFVALIGTQCCTVAALIWNEGWFSDRLPLLLKMFLRNFDMIGIRSVAAGLREVSQYSPAHDLFADVNVRRPYGLANV